MFSSNDTPAEEFILAKQLGATINLDDITHIEFLKECANPRKDSPAVTIQVEFSH